MSGVGDGKRSWKGSILKHGYWSEFCLSSTGPSCAALGCLPGCGCTGDSWSFTSSGAMAAKMREVACRKSKASVFTLMPIDGCLMQGLVVDAGLGGGYRDETQGPRFCITTEACQPGEHGSSAIGS